MESTTITTTMGNLKKAFEDEYQSDKQIIDEYCEFKADVLKLFEVLEEQAETSVFSPIYKALIESELYKKIKTKADV